MVHLCDDNNNGMSSETMLAKCAGQATADVPSSAFTALFATSSLFHLLSPEDLYRIETIKHTKRAYAFYQGITDVHGTHRDFNLLHMPYQKAVITETYDLSFDRYIPVSDAKVKTVGDIEIVCDVKCADGTIEQTLRKYSDYRCFGIVFGDLMCLTLDLAKLPEEKPAWLSQYAWDSCCSAKRNGDQRYRIPKWQIDDPIQVRDLLPYCTEDFSDTLSLFNCRRSKIFNNLKCKVVPRYFLHKGNLEKLPDSIRRQLDKNDIQFVLDNGSAVMVTVDVKRKTIQEMQQ